MHLLGQGQKAEEPEQSIEEEEIDEYSDSENERNDEYESKAEKSLVSDSSIMGGKINEISMKSKVTMLKHACPAYEYPFIKTEWTKQELRNFHRPEACLRGKKWKIRVRLFVNRKISTLSMKFY